MLLIYRRYLNLSNLNLEVKNSLKFQRIDRNRPIMESFK